MSNLIFYSCFLTFYLVISLMLSGTRYTLVSILPSSTSYYIRLIFYHSEDVNNKNDNNNNNDDNEKIFTFFLLNEVYLACNILCVFPTLLHQLIWLFNVGVYFWIFSCITKLINYILYNCKYSNCQTMMVVEKIL